MTIPASGPISMSMFNTELLRTSTTANSRLVSGSKPAGVLENVPGTGSLFWLANASSSLDQTAPHSMSEWYSYSSTYSLRISASLQSNITVGNNPRVYYKINAGGTYTALGSNIASTTCTGKGTVSGLKRTDTVYIIAVDSTNTSIGATFYGNDNTNVCSGTGTLKCNAVGGLDADSFAVTMTTNILVKDCTIRINVTSGQYVAC